MWCSLPGLTDSVALARATAASVLERSRTFNMADGESHTGVTDDMNELDLNDDNDDDSPYVESHTGVTEDLNQFNLNDDDDDDSQLLSSMSLLDDDHTDYEELPPAKRQVGLRRIYVQKYRLRWLSSFF